jgi:hypothetical protein
MGLTNRYKRNGEPTELQYKPKQDRWVSKAIGKQGGFRIFSSSFPRALSNKSIEIGYDKKLHLGSF